MFIGKLVLQLDWLDLYMLGLIVSHGLLDFSAKQFAIMFPAPQEEFYVIWYYFLMSEKRGRNC